MGGDGGGEGRCGLGNPEGRELGARAGGRRGGGEGAREIGHSKPSLSSRPVLNSNEFN